MKNNILSFALIIMSAFIVSCEKYNADEDSESKEANSTLVVRTRAAAANASGDEAEISYPVNVYVFNSSDKCVAASTIASESATLELNLPEGNYNVYAIAGADADNYDLPTQTNATKDYVIALKDGKSNADLMTAHSAVTLSYGEENTLTLSLARKVMLLETVTISGVPTAVTAVSVTITPLYENLLLNGSYEGANGSQTVSLTKDADGTTWKNECNAYLLEASGDATIKVSFTTESGTTSYSYSSSNELKANYKININGTYVGGDLKLSGTITGATWNGTKDINFSFTESGSTEDENGGSSDSGNDETGGQETTGSAPAAGTFYNGCYVLKSTTVSNGTQVVLLAPKEQSKLTFTEGDQTSIKAAVDAALSEIAVSGIEGWRLPTLDEITYIIENMSEINKAIDGQESFQRFGTLSTSYYYLDGQNQVAAITASTKNTYSPKNDTATRVRALATVTFTN